MSIFKITVTGDYRKAKNLNLTLSADYENCQKTENVTYKKKDILSLEQDISDLSGFMETKYPSVDINKLMLIGDKLFKFIFQGSINDLFNIAIGRIGQNKLPIKLIIEDHSIASWPWEYMYKNNLPICNNSFPIYRNTFNNNQINIPNHSNQIEILFIIGITSNDLYATSPKPYSKFFTDNNIKFNIIQAPSDTDLLNALQNNNYNVLHFYGHGGRGYFRVDDENSGNSHNISTHQIIPILKGKDVKLVFLNACKTAQTVDSSSGIINSSIAADLLNNGIPAVIGNQFSIPDTTANCFAFSVYKALFQGKSISEAVCEGRQAISFTNNIDNFNWGIPVLYTSAPDMLISQPPPPPPPGNKVFLSYSNKDKQFAERLAKDLNKDGIDIWFDEWEINLSDIPIDKRGKSLNESKHFLFILSPNSVAGIDAGMCNLDRFSWLNKIINGERTGLIPIYYHNCITPPFLDIFRGLKINDNNYNQEYIRLKNHLLGISNRPPLK